MTPRPSAHAYLSAYAAGSLTLFLAALAISARSCTSLAAQERLRPSLEAKLKGLGSGPSRRLWSAQHAGVPFHASTTCCTELASMKSAFVICGRPA